jgi:hypothetical protein
LKKGLLGILFLIFIFGGFEIFSQVYYLNELETCGFTESEIFENVPESTLDEMCSLQFSIKVPSEPTQENIPNQHNEYVNINSFGFRGVEISKEKPENVYRIIMLGGSTLFGYGASSDETTIPGFLQKKFETTDSDFKVEVINAGSSGAYSKTETLYVKHKLLDFDPDLIIVYDGWNDSRIPYTSHIGERGLAGQLYDSVNHLQSIFPYYKTPIVIREIGRDLISAEEDTIATRIDANLDKKVILWKERWNESCLLAQENDIKTLITIQPMLGTGDRIVTKSEKSTSGLLQNDFMQLPLYQLQKFVDVLPELTNCTNTADLTHVFDGHNEPIFLDLGHVGEQGSMLISEKIYELVLPIINTE